MLENPGSYSFIPSIVVITVWTLFTKELIYIVKTTTEIAIELAIQTEIEYQHRFLDLYKKRTLVGTLTQTQILAIRLLTITL